MNWLVALLIFIHLLATVMWIGGVVFVMLVLMPVMERHKELGPAAGRLTVDTTKRFMVLVWGSIILFFLSGVPMTIFNPQFLGLIDISNPWSVTILTKHIVVAVMVIGAVAQTFTIRSMDRLLRVAQKQTLEEKPTPAKMPSEMAKLRRRQMTIGVIVLILGILALLLTAIAEAVFIPG